MSQKDTRMMSVNVDKSWGEGGSEGNKSWGEGGSE